MHISDKLGQYNRNVNSGTEELRGAQSVQKLVSTVGELSKGSVFEGTVNSVRGGKVTLALGNGQVILARMDGRVDIKPGTAMFFQVRSNEGGTVMIRPYNGVGNVSNPILLNALTSAQVPVTERTLTMVDAMMQEQMSVNRQSILDMVKVVTANPEANVRTIVQMTKLGLPISEEMASQFENYLSDRHELLDKMELAAGQLAELLGEEELAPEEAFALYSRALDIFSAKEQVAGDAAKNEMQYPNINLSDSHELPDNMKLASSQAAQLLGEKQPAPKEAGTSYRNGEAAGDELQHLKMNMPQTETAQANTAADVHLENTQAARLFSIFGAAESKTGVSEENQIQGNSIVQEETLEKLLSPEQLENLGKALQELPVFAQNRSLFSGAADAQVPADTMSDEAAAADDADKAKAIGLPEESEMQEKDTVELAENEKQAAGARAVIDKNMSAAAFFRTLQSTLEQNAEYSFLGIKKLFAKKEFQTLFKNMAREQWMLKPQEIKKEKLTKLYERMEQQINQLENVVKSTGMTQNSFLQSAADIRENINFMNQMNQIYNYIQLPLKMSGQNANGELYVYTNKKNKNDPEAELTAFLHLDMENLGATDVSVRLKNRQVKTNFYLEEDASYDLVEKHLPILEKHLKKKGYNCSITITNEKRDVNFKDNFVKHGQGSIGTVHRYSFDVRA